MQQTCTIPIDTAKVRLQLQGKALQQGVPVPLKYRGMFGTIGTIAREEGLLSLWRGIVPGLHRQCLFGGLRIGLYEPVRICSEFLQLLRYVFVISMISVNSMYFWIVKAPFLEEKLTSSFNFYACLYVGDGKFRWVLSLFALNLDLNVFR